LHLLDKLLGSVEVEGVEVSGHVCQCGQTVGVKILVLRIQAVPLHDNLITLHCPVKLTSSFDH